MRRKEHRTGCPVFLSKLIVIDKIVALAGDVPRIELFARQATPGWDVWGNEVDSSVSFP